MTGFKGAAAFLVAFLVTAAATDERECRKVIIDGGLSRNFNETVAHAVHSMTVQGLRLFNPLATEDNHVPTVNMDRQAPEKVVPYAPNDPLGSDFSTFTMNTIDKILSGIGSNNDGLGPNWSPVERIVHKFHMWDLWQRVHEVYESSTLVNPPKEDVCKCLMQTKENGIYAAVKWVSDHYDVGTPITLLNRPIPKLADAKSWAVWKKRLLHYYTKDGLKDAATFIYCATKDF